VEDVTLSGLLAEPDHEPRALVLALHGHGMSSAYFAGRADPRLSLLDLGARLGYTVWAPDRLGYGTSAPVGPDRLPMFPQADFLADAIDVFARERAVGAGCFLVGHSFGLKLSLALAASGRRGDLLGIDGSGSGLRYAFDFGAGVPPARPGDRSPHWGPGHLYPPATFRRANLPVAPMPHVPESEGARWPDDFRSFAARVRVPVRFTFGDHERLWVVSDEAFAELRAVLTGSPRVVIEVQRGAGHNVSLSTAARAYHLKALAFAEECLNDGEPAVDAPAQVNR
jgi:pimeloyl-ACP methyl ester carboxylesterase